MASANDPTRKRTSESNVDDASVPTPKRTRDNNSNVEDVKDKQDKLIKSLKENPTSALALTELLSCDACQSFARAPIRYCDKCHTICSLCFVEAGKKCPAAGCKDKLYTENVENTQLTKVIHAMKLPVPCKNWKNGCPKKGEEKEVEEHEIECEFRIVNPNWWTTRGKMFKELYLVFENEAKINKQKWILYGNDDSKNAGKKYFKAFRDSIEPDGHIFTIYVESLCYQKDSSIPVFVAYAIVLGGEHVANKYRVELRLNSSEKEFTNTHHGPVFSVDVEQPWNCEEAYTVDMKRFALFNKGVDFFGDHNKDMNGEIKIPIVFKIIKKELDIPKEDPGTPVDMDAEKRNTNKLAAPTYDRSKKPIVFNL